MGRPIVYSIYIHVNRCLQSEVSLFHVVRWTPGLWFDGLVGLFSSSAVYLTVTRWLCQMAVTWHAAERLFSSPLEQSPSVLRRYLTVSHQSCKKIFDLGVIESYKKCDHFLLLVQVLSAAQLNALRICCWFHKQSGVLLFSQWDLAWFHAWPECGNTVILKW